MKKSVRNTLALLLALCMTAGLFAGCAPKTPAPTPPVTPEVTKPVDPVKEPVVMKVIANSADVPASSLDTAVGKVIKEKFNIEFNFIPMPTNYADQCSIWLAGGDYPEVMRLPSIPILQQYVDAGALLSLETYLPNMKNFSEKRADQIPYWRSESADGKLYLWENATPQAPATFRDDYDVLVRTDLLEQQGWPETISASQYLEFMKKAVADNPKTDGKNTIGMTFAGAEAWGPGMAFNLSEKGASYFNFNDVVMGDIKENKFVNRIELPEIKESAKFYNDLYRAKLLDKEAYSLTDADCLAKMTTGQPAVYYYGRWNVAPANAALTTAGLDERHYIELPIQLDSQKGGKRQLVQAMVRPLETLVMTKNCKNPERFTELLDWWQTDEAQLLGGSGVEGTDYEIKDGKRVPLAPLADFMSGKNPTWAKTVGAYDSGLYSVSLGYRNDLCEADGQPFRITKDPDLISQYGLSERQKEAYTALGWENSKSWYDENGAVYYEALMKAISIDPASDFGKDIVKISELFKQYSSKIVFSENDEEFDKNFNELVTEVSKYNPQAITDEYNRLLAEAKTKIK